MTPIDKLVLYGKFNQERMTDIYRTGAIVMAAQDPNAAAGFMKKFIDMAFPEFIGTRERTMAEKVEELKDFTKSKVSLVEGPGGWKLNLEEGDK